MLDAFIRPILNPPLKLIAQNLSSLNVSANTITLTGLGFGLLAMGLIFINEYILAAFCIGINRLCDGLDGVVASISGATDFGGFLDITCDFIIYAGIIFAFGYSQPENSLYAAFLIFSYIGPITTFLAYAIMAEKRQITTDVRGKKSFYYLGGICEGTETAFVMILLCLQSNWLAEICVIYGAMCWLTTLGRISSAWTLASYTEQAIKTKQQDL